ncbi:hypothetical protein [Leisingera caerulea]|uniref:hypothetical protein n=1 Tax=Leisingera caerulea TaxID=506591 RepID=UPI0021A7B7BD|nr:hypothetical protein [Leisingera caerulea]UWQ84381.1 hypothetical protein K3726_04065 [Leisingera caerulea]
MSVFDNEKHRETIGKAIAEAIGVVFGSPEREAGRSLARGLDICNTRIEEGTWDDEQAESYIELVIAAEAAAIAASRKLREQKIKRAIVSVLMSFAKVANGEMRWPILPI